MTWLDVLVHYDNEINAEMIPALSELRPELQYDVIRRPGHWVIPTTWRDITPWAPKVLKLFYRADHASMDNRLHCKSSSACVLLSMINMNILRHIKAPGVSHRVIWWHPLHFNRSTVCVNNYEVALCYLNHLHDLWNPEVQYYIRIQIDYPTLPNRSQIMTTFNWHLFLQNSFSCCPPDLPRPF